MPEEQTGINQIEATIPTAEWGKVLWENGDLSEAQEARGGSSEEGARILSMSSGGEAMRRGEKKVVEAGG